MYASCPKAFICTAINAQHPLNELETQTSVITTRTTGTSPKSKALGTLTLQLEHNFTRVLQYGPISINRMFQGVCYDISGMGLTQFRLVLDK